MRYGIKGNGIAIGVEHLPKQKNPSLTVYADDKDEKTLYKVATFKSTEDAEWFVEMAAEVLGVRIRK